MSMPAPESGGNPQGQPIANQQPQQQAPQGTGNNRPPYAEYLDKFPEAYRPIADPVFKEWDANVTRMRQADLQKLNEYSGYDELVQQYEPQYLSQAAQLAQMLEENPQMLLQGLAEALGIEMGGQNPDIEDDSQTSGFDLSQDPAFQQLQEQLGGMAEQFQNQMTQQQQEAEDNEVLDELDSMHEQYGEFDDELLLMIAAANPDAGLEGAWQTYQQKVGQQAASMNQPGQQAPIVSGGGNGSMPSNNVNPGQWSDAQRKEAALALARAMKNQG